MIDDALPRTTDRVRLRRFVTGDLARFQAYRRDPDVGCYQGWSAMDNAAAAAFLAEMAATPVGMPGEWWQIAIAEILTNDLIGDIGACLRGDGAAEIGFSLAPGAQGQGLAAEAVACAIALLFEFGRVDAIEGITDARNLPSIRLLERVGMRVDRMQETMFRGAMCTECVYGISRAQWDALANSSNSRHPR